MNEGDELRFFLRPPGGEEPEGAPEEEKKVFEFAIGIDHAARELIRYVLSVAAERSADVVKPWLEEAVKSRFEATAELRVLIFIAGALLKSQDQAKQQAMLDRIDRLESFANAALFLAGDLRKTLSPSTDEPGD
ncbi:hypothetical protein IB260_00105 [Pseudomonas sp. PDM23]|uniref:hypothetical protein n=1 Tax=unclassified Pseudomonas TaxID=196821 RepID=UPI00177C27A6|nr:MULTISPECIES: hypothetical protein [unclassified Pseudomonas]MBD9573698.1 hypothetical protein [Pseudomonas sp. PDM23]MBD9675013.1 hypothetical protein [Pseudomonas sp. PDM21]